MKNKKLLFPVYFMLALTVTSINTYGNRVKTGKEMAWLLTDREFYIAGENVFFKLYLLDADTHKPSNISKIAYLVLRNQASVPVVKIKFRVENGTASGCFVLPDSLKSGPCQVTVFTNWMRNFGEESFFKREIFVANRFDKDITTQSNVTSTSEKRNENSGQVATDNFSLSVSTDKTSYNKRDKIRLSLDSQVPPFDTARLSVSVFEVVPGITDDLPDGNILKADNSVKPQFIQADNIRFLPEVKGEIIQGHVVGLDSKEPIANAIVFLSAADTLANLQYTITDAKGMFRFLMNDYYYDKDLNFSVKGNQDVKRLQIIPEDKFDLKNIFKPSPETGNPALKEYILKSQDLVTIQKIYQSEQVSKPNPKYLSTVCIPQLYYKPNYCIYPADFVPLNDFAEIAREILPPQFSLKKRNEIYTANMADENRHVYFDQEPIVFLDGVYIDNVNQVMKFGSDKVERVELVCRSYNFGDLIFPGILAVFSKKNEIKNLQPTESSLRIQLQGFQVNAGFEAPAYNHESQANLPDFRQLLYWNPAIEFSGSHFVLPGFYASDHSGNYILRAEGITSGGIPLRATSTINIK